MSHAEAVLDLLTSPLATTSLAPTAQGTLRVGSATLTTRTASSRALLPTRSAPIVTHINAIDRCPFFRCACLHWDESMASSCVCFSSSPTSKPTITLIVFAALGYEAHQEEFCHRRCIFFHCNWCTIGMPCAQAVSLRGASTIARRHVPVPRRAGGG